MLKQGKYNVKELKLYSLFYICKKINILKCVIINNSCIIINYYFWLFAEFER